MQKLTSVKKENVGNLSIYYIYKSESGWLAGFVCMLLGDSCYAAGAFSLGSVPRTRWWANVAFSLGSVLGLLLGNDNTPVVFSLWSCCWAAAQQWGGVFLGVRSEGPLPWEHQSRVKLLRAGTHK
jgi:hypothetical protein